jgi:hypothetical protein
MSWVIRNFTIDDNLGQRFDWRTVLVAAAYLVVCDAVAWLAGGPVGGVALLAAILWFTK